jgi:HK97 family phage major capsid protein
LLDIIDALEMYASGEPRRQTLSQQLVEALQPYRESRSLPSGGVRVSATGGIRALVTTADVDSSVLAPSQPTMTQPQRRRLFLRDVCPVVPIGTMSTPFVRELSPLAVELAASGVAEGTTKPDATGALNFHGDVVTQGVLAINITVTSQLWADAPAFVAYVDGQLPYWTRVREEFACFRGAGEVVNAGITGLLNDSNISASTATAGSLVGSLLAGAHDLAGDGVDGQYMAFVNALDWVTELKATFAGGTAAGLEVLDRAGVLVLPTISLPTGSAVVGDFGNGAVIVERQEVGLAVYEQHDTYRARNLELVQGEERIGWHVTAPWRFRTVAGW